MRDRTKELGNKGYASDDDDEGESLMKPGGSSAKEEKDNESFFRKVQEIHEGLYSLKRMVCDLENKQKRVLGVALPEEGMKKELQMLRDEIKMLAGQIQRKLKSIEPKKGDDDGKYVSVNVRMQRTQHAVLSREFVELMSHCKTIQAQYRDRNVERIQRQLKISETHALGQLSGGISCGNDGETTLLHLVSLAGTKVTDEELDSMLESGQTDVFTQNILNDAKATKQALNEIESRHDEILKLERSIRDLHDMFQYLAMEVEAQGETVDQIEHNIKQSSNYVERAKENTEKAVTYQQKARKKKIWIAICLAVVILILAISLAATFS